MASKKLVDSSFVLLPWLPTQSPSTYETQERKWENVTQLTNKQAIYFRRGYSLARSARRYVGPLGKHTHTTHARGT